MAIENNVRRALIERKVTFGTWIQINNPAVSEILANAGYDWIAVDCEHTDIDITGFANIIRGMYGRGAVPFIRVRENDTLAIHPSYNIRKSLDIDIRMLTIYSNPVVARIGQNFRNSRVVNLNPCAKSDFSFEQGTSDIIFNSHFYSSSKKLFCVVLDTFLQYRQDMTGNFSAKDFSAEWR